MFSNKRLGTIAIVFTLIILVGMFSVVYIYKKGNDELISPSPETSGLATDAEMEEDKHHHTVYEIESIEEVGEFVVVTTSYGVFKYPYAFSDLIAIEALETGSSAQLQFFVRMEDEKNPIYTIYYNSGEGSLCGNLELSEDEKLSVWVVFADMPEGLSDDWQQTFYAVKETFNDVLFSMAEDPKFCLVE